MINTQQAEYDIILTEGLSIFKKLIILFIWNVSDSWNKFPNLHKLFTKCFFYWATFSLKWRPWPLVAPIYIYKQTSIGLIFTSICRSLFCLWNKLSLYWELGTGQKKKCVCVCVRACACIEGYQKEMDLSRKSTVHLFLRLVYQIVCSWNHSSKLNSTSFSVCIQAWFQGFYTSFFAEKKVYVYFEEENKNSRQTTYSWELRMRLDICSESLMVVKVGKGENFESK